MNSMFVPKPDVNSHLSKAEEFLSGTSLESLPDHLLEDIMALVPADTAPSLAHVSCRISRTMRSTGTNEDIDNAKELVTSTLV